MPGSRRSTRPPARAPRSARGLPLRYAPDGTVAKAGAPKETRELDGRPCVLERALRADFALARAHTADTADTAGNLRHRLTARSFNPMAALAGAGTIAEAERVVDAPGRTAIRRRVAGLQDTRPGLRRPARRDRLSDLRPTGLRSVADQADPPRLPASPRRRVDRGGLDHSGARRADRSGSGPPGEASIRRYNEQVRAGADLDFGRPTGAEGVGHGPIDTPPFYGFRCAAGLTATYCGVAMDDRLRVIDVFGDAIPGLYAAGEVVGGFHGAGYLTGTALGKAAVFGHLTGTTAASRPPLASTTGSRAGTTAGQQRPTAPRRRWPAGGTEPSA
ncbi:FAD-binding protein [Streptomyces malaysiensis]|uniref:FAD-binding protein n=1 Tax=Streptomyces malaysiensis TaxID=92644 RepID=UPI0028C45459|nr:FAD-binding protein [Streptomyces malaysiensis]